MPTRKLKDFLDKEKVEYVSIQHPLEYTMPRVAHTAHLPGKMVAKTIMIKVDGIMAMAVLPSSNKADLGHLKDLIGADSVVLATEEEFERLIPGCEVGAMPPFGNLYGMVVYVSPELAELDEIAFNAGTHTELVKLAYSDFDRLVHPKVLHFVS